MDAFWHTTGLSFVLIGVVLIVAAVCLLFQMMLEAVSDWLDQRRERRIARIEAELDVKSEELRRTIFAIADGIAADRERAARTMREVASKAGEGRSP